MSVSLTWDPSPDADVVGYNIYYGYRSQSYTNKVTVGNVTLASVPNLQPGVTYYFAATAFNGENLESEFSNEAVYTVPLGTNTAPTLNLIADLSIAENALKQTVNLTGISSGSTGETQVLKISAVSSNPTLIPNPTVTYTSPGTTGTLGFTPVANASGSAQITVTVDDGGGTNNIIQRQFTVTVAPVNRAPTLNAIANLTLSGPGTVPLSGISSGLPSEAQTLTVTASSSNPTLLPNPVVTYSSPSATGSLSLTPKAGASGQATITVTVSDGQTVNGSTQRQFVVTVAPINLPPTLNPIASLQLEENAAARTVQLSGISTGAATETQTLKVSALSGNPTLVPNPTVNYTSPSATGSLVVSPVKGQSGQAVITVTVEDGQSTSNFVKQQFTVTVVPTNRPPTLDILEDLVLNEDAGPQTIALKGISTGAAAETQTITITAISRDTTLIPTPAVTYTSPGSTGTLILEPVKGKSGDTLVTVMVSDGQTTIQRLFAVFVLPANRPPTLDTIADLELDENATAQTVQLSGIGTGLATETQTLKITAVSSNPLLVPNPVVTYTSPAATGSLVVLPMKNLSGQAVITVTVDDGQDTNNFVKQQFTVTVAPANRPPTLDAIADLVLDENAGSQNIPLTGITAGAATESQTLTITATSSDPTIVPNPVVKYTSPGTTGILVLTPAPSKAGDVTIRVMVNDGQSANAVTFKQFAVFVLPVNRPPTLNPIANVKVDENAGAQTVQLSGISAGSATETQTLEVTAVSSNPSLVPNPVVTYTSPSPTGSLVFTPMKNMSGQAVITVTVEDGEALSGSVQQQFTVTVAPANRPPTLNPIANVKVDENAGAQTVQLSGISAGSVTETQTLGVTAVSSNPSLVPNPTVNYTSPSPTGSLVFTPMKNMSGQAVITVTVEDGQALSSSVQQQFTVTVAPGNRPPTLDPITDIVLDENTGPQTIPLTGITAGSATESQTLTITATSSDPTIVPNPVVTYTSPGTTGTLVLTPVASQTGDVIITVMVNDGQSANAVTFQQFAVFVLPVNRPPTLDPVVNVKVAENSGPITVQLTGISSGSASEAQTLKVTATSSNPALVPDPLVTYSSPASTASLRLSPVTGASGTAVITVRVDDGETANSAVEQQFTVYVTPLNRPPTLDPVASLNLGDNSGTQMVALSGISTGAESESQPLKVTAVSSNPTVVANPIVNYVSPNGTGSLVLSVTPDAIGTAVITVTVDDGQVANNVVRQQFTVTVFSANQTPTLASIPDVTVAENSGAQGVALSGISAGSVTEDQQEVIVRAYSSNPSLIPDPGVTYAAPAGEATLTFAPLPNSVGTAVITVEVNDGQAHNNITRQSFTITVQRVLADVTFAETPVKSGAEGVVPVNLFSTQGAKEVTVSFEAPAGYFSNPRLQDLSSEVGVSSVSFSAVPGSLSTMQFKTRANKQFTGSQTLGKLVFSTTTGKPSSFVQLRIVRINAKLADGTQVSKEVNYTARMAFVADKPLLDLKAQADGSRSLVLYGDAAATYAIEQTTGVGPGATWNRLAGEVPMSSLASELGTVNQAGSVGFFRAVRVR